MLRAKKRKTRKILFRMILFFLLLLFLILGIRSWIEPTVEERLSYQSRVLVTAAINQTVAEELERLGVTYHQMIHLTRDGTGRITLYRQILYCSIKSKAPLQSKWENACRNYLPTDYPFLWVP